MKASYGYLILIVIVLFSVLCKGQDTSKIFDYGKVEGNKYVNNYFNFSLTIPEGWVVQSRELTNDLAEKGKKMIAGDDEKLNTMIEASEVNTAYLLTVFQFEVGYPVDYNPNFLITAENLKGTPGIKNGSDYLFQARRLLKHSNFKYDNIDDDFAEINIGGKDFYSMGLSVSVLDMTVRQVYYSTVEKDFAIGIVMSYTTDDQKQILDNMIKSVDFY